MIHSGILNHVPRITAMMFLMLSSVIVNAQLSNYTFVQQTTPVVTVTSPCDASDFNWHGSSIGCSMDSDVRCADPYIAETTINLAQPTALLIHVNPLVCLGEDCMPFTMNTDIYIDGVYIGNVGVGGVSSGVVLEYTANLSAGTHTIRYEFDGDAGTATEVLLSYRNNTTTSIGYPYISADGSVTIDVLTGGSIVIDGLNPEDEIILTDAIGRTEHYTSASFTTTLRGIVNVTVVSPQRSFRQKIMVME